MFPIERTLIIACLALLLSGCGYNNLTAGDEQVKASWAEVINQYQRRADLIPNLVATVKGYAAHERETLDSVVQARAQAASFQVPQDITTNPEAMRQFQTHQDQLGSALARLLVTVERYPDLKASQNFLTLQSQLEGTENRIAVARRDYIEAVRLYNTELKTIPGRWWRDWLYPENQPMASFSAPEASAAGVPKVAF